uniref:Uncharacterized protein n=1 Tax=Plectus sambesii TaxID=2011161 RepID=A0A914WLF1_9BILA
MEGLEVPTAQTRANLFNRENTKSPASFYREDSLNPGKHALWHRKKGAVKVERREWRGEDKEGLFETSSTAATADHDDGRVANRTNTAVDQQHTMASIRADDRNWDTALRRHSVTSAFHDRRRAPLANRWPTDFAD